MNQSTDATKQFYEETSVFDIAEFCKKNNVCVDFRDNTEYGFNFTIANELNGYIVQDNRINGHLGTRASLNTLAPKYHTFLENRKKVLRNTTRKDEVVGEIRGYLSALRTVGIISDLDFRLILSYYTAGRHDR